MKQFDQKLLLVYYSEPTPPGETKLYNSLKKICPDTTLMFTFDEKHAQRNRLVQRIFHRLKIPLDLADMNGRMKKWAAEHRPDVVFIVKGVNVRPSTFKFLKKLDCRLVSWSNDDMYAWHGRSLFYTWGLKHYDLVVTQKSYNCLPEELPSLGARRVLFQDKAYDPALHFPCENEASPAMAHEVLFIGAFEAERLAALTHLAQNGVTVHIYGWGREEKNEHSNLIFHNRHLYGADFRCAITHAKICLNFLRKVNRDRQTSRSVEIPACRGFMLAERTDEHLALFREGEEAEFFGDADELLQKIRFYLQNEALRRQIAQKGYEKCLSAGYSFDHRMSEILENLFCGSHLEATCRQ